MLPSPSGSEKVSTIGPSNGPARRSSRRPGSDVSSSACAATRDRATDIAMVSAERRRRQPARWKRVLDHRTGAVYERRSVTAPCAHRRAERPACRGRAVAAPVLAHALRSTPDLTDPRPPPPNPEVTACQRPFLRSSSATSASPTGCASSSPRTTWHRSSRSTSGTTWDPSTSSPGQDRLRAPVRARHVPGLPPCRQGRTRRADPGGRRDDERLHLAGSDELLRDAARAPAGARALARGRPDGDAPRCAEPGEPRQPARGRQEREALVVRQPAVWLVAGEAPGPPVPARAPLPPLDDRVDGRPGRGVARGCQRVLPDLLRPEQRGPERGR